MMIVIVAVTSFGIGFIAATLCMVIWPPKPTLRRGRK